MFLVVFFLCFAPAVTHHTKGDVMLHGLARAEASFCGYGAAWSRQKVTL